MPDFDLSITICSWNTKDDLQACLASLQDVRNEANFEVIVVENDSEDGSGDMVAAKFPWVTLYRMERNLGFTGGQNYALEHRRGRHALLLNSDTVVHPGAIRTLMAYVEDHPEAGIVGPRLLNPDGTLQYSCRRFPNPVAALFRNTPIGRLFPNNRFTRDYLMQDWSHDQVRDVDWVSGAALLATETCIQRIGLLDNEYYMFCEDVDWCWQCHEAGLAVRYVPDAIITHAVGRSTDKAPNRMIGRFHRSMFRFYQKNMVPKMPPLIRPLALAFAATALTGRAGMFITKNKIDLIMRRLRKQG